jgi:hypothetical protein
MKLTILLLALCRLSAFPLADSSSKSSSSTLPGFLLTLSSSSADNSGYPSRELALCLLCFSSSDSLESECKVPRLTAISDFLAFLDFPAVVRASWPSKDDSEASLDDFLPERGPFLCPSLLSSAISSRMDGLLLRTTASSASIGGLASPAMALSSAAVRTARILDLLDAEGGALELDSNTFDRNFRPEML